MKVQTRSFTADAIQITGDIPMRRVEELGLKWDEYGGKCGRRGLYSETGGINIPVSLGSWHVTYENGETRIFPEEGFHEIFEPVEA